MTDRLTEFVATLMTLAALVVLAGCSDGPFGRGGTGEGETAETGEAAGAPLGAGVSVGVADGVIDDPLPVDAAVPAVTRLDPRLRAAVRAAAREAGGHGITVRITSGWRSQRYQSRLYEQAVRREGSEARARRLVASPASSEHVSGDAVDIGPTAAAYWMSRHGERFGLCRIYRNEVWHYELKTGTRCPVLVADAAARRR
ncbi:hypothetical protein GCM10027289_24910 [Tsukamurella serpentis]